MSYSIYLLLSIAGFLFSLGASFATSSIFKKYSNTPVAKNITPAEFAKQIVEGEGLNVDISFVAGQLGDNFDPFKRVVNLNAETAQVPGISQLAVTAHEFGHALQAKNSGFLFTIRNMLAGVVNISTSIGYVLLLAGLFLSLFGLAEIGLILFSATTIFMFITLPIEIDASAKGMGLLKKYNILTPQEVGPARSLLTAAAFTYIAGFLQSLLQLVYFMSLISGRRRRG